MRLVIVYLMVVLVVLNIASPSVANTENFTTLFMDAEADRNAGRYPQAEEKLLQALELSPENTDVMLYLGMVQAYQKKYALAIETINKALSFSPGNLDLKILSARVKSWSGLHDEAQQEVAKIISLEPNNIEAILLAARIYYYTEDLDKAETLFKRALELDPFSNAALQGLSEITTARQTLSKSIPETVPLDARWRLDTGYSTSRFNSGNRKNWHETFVNLSRSVGENTYAMRVDRARRFGVDDTYIRLGLNHHFTKSTSGYVRTGGTSNADFLARWTFETGGSLRLWQGNDWVGPTVLTVDLKQKDYSSGDVRNIDSGMQQYFLDNRVWLTAKQISTRDVAAGKTHPGWFLRTDLQVNDDMRVFIGYSDTGESEQGTTAETTSQFFGFVGDISPALGFNVSYTRDDRESIYIRKVYAAGVSLKF